MQTRSSGRLVAFTSGAVLAALVAALVAAGMIDSGRTTEHHLPGLPGITGHEVVSVDSVFGPTTTSFSGSVTAPCPAGKKVLGGGMTTLIRSMRTGAPTVGATASGATLLTSHPAAAVDGWTVAVSLTLSSTLRGVRVFATCAAAS